MTRNQSKRVTRVLTVEEQTRCANFFMILIEIDQRVGVTRRRGRPPSSAQAAKKVAPSRRRNATKR